MCRRTDADDGLVCDHCDRTYPIRDHVLLVDAPAERAEVLAERAAVASTERDAGLGGINDTFDDLAHAEGPLRDALLALPDGNDSRYYREPGYFLNVRNSRRGFRFVCDRLDTTPGQRLLDIGADLTWSTSHFARQGLRCVALDVNHHLSVGALFQAGHGTSYDMVRADMHAPVFRDACFDVVVAFNALHHGGDLDRLAANLARVLMPGGRLAAVEPYCVDEAQKEAFGRAQIDAGINEHTYLVDEWHDAFTRAGLVLEEVMLADACCMIYRRPGEADAPPGQKTMLEGAYAGGLVVRASSPSTDGATLDVQVDITNAGNATWCSEGAGPVYASYHLARRGGDGATMVSFDNRRTPIPDVRPGTTTRAVIVVDVPAGPGEYLVSLDLVHEGLCWFAQKGFGGATITISRPHP